MHIADSATPGDVGVEVVVEVVVVEVVLVTGQTPSLKTLCVKVYSNLQLRWRLLLVVVWRQECGICGDNLKGSGQRQIRN